MLIIIVVCINIALSLQIIEIRPRLKKLEPSKNGWESFKYDVSYITAWVCFIFHSILLVRAFSC